MIKAQSGQFVDMRDFLSDNVALLQQLEAFGIQSTVCISWRSEAMAKGCLHSATLAILLSGVHGCLYWWSMLAYACLIIREAQRHGGSGWLDYDRVFRQQAALDPSVKWNELHPGIQAATLVGRSSGLVPSCRICREPDH